MNRSSKKKKNDDLKLEPIPKVNVYRGYWAKVARKAIDNPDMAVVTKPIGRGGTGPRMRYYQYLLPAGYRFRYKTYPDKALVWISQDWMATREHIEVE